MAEKRTKETDEQAPPEREERKAPETPARNGARQGQGPRDETPGAPAASAGTASGTSAGGSAPAATAASVPGPWRSYKELVAQLADRIVEAQKPIRVLQALRWDESIEENFRKTRPRVLPKIDAAYYERGDLGFEPRAKAEEFEAIARDVRRNLGETDAIGLVMLATALDYRDVVNMLAARGTPGFYAGSRKLYGSPKDKFPDGRSTVRDLGRQLYGTLTNIDETARGLESTAHPRNIDAAEAARQLSDRLGDYFGDAHVRVEPDDGILADAAAGRDYVKVRTGAKFSSRDIDILEVHEGWVHVATSLNGQAQPVAKWLAKGPPRTAAAQEGLAALVEMFTFRAHPRRARRLNDRVLAVDKAEDGANFLDVFEWFRTEGYDEDECFNGTRRVFRGGIIEGGGPFTKDACYCKGIVLNYAFIRSAIQHNRVDLIPLLFVGKVAHEDIPVLARHIADGVVRSPQYLPPMFRDLNGLAIWMAYSTFFSQLGGEVLAEHYGRVFNCES